MSIDPDKYIVFKRDEFYDSLDTLHKLVFPSHNRDAMSGSAEERQEKLLDWSGNLHKSVLADAVILRRQDRFTGPALHTYTAMMNMAVRFMEPSKERTHLSQLADYFHEQAVLSDEESFKVPD